MGVTPTYVVDYPVATQPSGTERLLEFVAHGRCTIGAHLHPWVTPPFDEEISGRNSFTLNLPPALQREKLACLTEAIQETFGVRPTIFKAGRYGLGAVTVGLLEELGYDIDMSVSPRLDFSAIGGPSFTDLDARPFFLTEQMLELPCTVDYTGWLRRAGPKLHASLSTPLLQRLCVPGILTRLDVLNRVMLSPEGNRLNEMCALTSALVADGCRTFTLSFHSPSVVPGHTPYVRTRRDLDRLLSDIERYCAFFFDEINGIPSTPHEFMQLARTSRSVFS